MKTSGFGSRWFHIPFRDAVALPMYEVVQRDKRAGDRGLRFWRANGSGKSSGKFAASIPLLKLLNDQGEANC